MYYFRGSPNHISPNTPPGTTDSHHVYGQVSRDPGAWLVFLYCMTYTAWDPLSSEPEFFIVICFFFLLDCSTNLLTVIILGKNLFIYINFNTLSIIKRIKNGCKLLSVLKTYRRLKFFWVWRNSKGIRIRIFNLKSMNPLRNVARNEKKAVYL